VGLDDPHSWGTLAPPPSGAFLHTRGGKIRTFPQSITRNRRRRRTGGRRRGVRRGDRERGVQQVANRPNPISDSQGTAGVVRKAPSFTHGATYK